MDWVSDTEGACLLRVRVVPRASRTEIVGIAGDVLRIRLQATPVDNKANEALIRFLADTLQLHRREITLVSGEHSRDKVLRIGNTDATSLIQRLGTTIAATATPKRGSP